MGPLHGVCVIEMAGIGPAPFACMLLADMGAEVIRIERKGAASADRFDVMARGRRSVSLDLKKPEAVTLALGLIKRADLLVEGFRPGVMEKLGLGPDACLSENPGLVYGRMTGWGQDGALSACAGHDINYIAITGALDAIGTENEGPVPPLNLLGDFGGGATYLVIGLLAALLEAKKSGKGQVVDAAITDGVISLLALQHGLNAIGLWSCQREDNLLDGGAHFYDTYQCADGKWIALGAIEPQFCQRLAEKLGIDVGVVTLGSQMDKKGWKKLKPLFAEAIRKKTRDEWCAILEGSDTCFAPVLNLVEAKDHPHNVSRKSFIEVDGVLQSAPAPRFSRTRSEVCHGPVPAGTDNRSVFREMGFSAEEIQRWMEEGVLS